jgi:hypothetical protein
MRLTAWARPTAAERTLTDPGHENRPRTWKAVLFPLGASVNFGPKAQPVTCRLVLGMAALKKGEDRSL